MEWETPAKATEGDPRGGGAGTGGPGTGREPRGSAPTQEAREAADSSATVTAAVLSLALKPSGWGAHGISLMRKSKKKKNLS